MSPVDSREGILRLRFTADDYGESQDTNSAIAHACAGGVIRSISVFASEASIYGSFNSGFRKDICFGAHLYLTEHMPLTDRLKKVAGQQKITKGIIVSRLITGKISSDGIYGEFEAQLSRLYRYGFDVKFIDTHQNIHGLPGIFHIVRNVGKKYGLENSIRPFAQVNFNLKQDVRTIFFHVYSRITGFKTGSRVLVGCPGYKEGRENMDYALDAWDIFLTRVKKKTYAEIYVPCHPGISPIEVRLYSSRVFYDLLLRHDIDIK